MAANPNDGTQLGTAEIISDEYIDPALQGVKRDPALPATAYKLPRSKIAVGPYGQDHGDATQDNPLPVEGRNVRQLDELNALRGRDAGLNDLKRYGSENVSLVDSRGSHLANRGVR